MGMGVFFSLLVSFAPGREIAEVGVAVMTGPSFVLNRVPPSFSPAYSIASSVVNKLIYESYLSGTFQ